MADVPVAVVSRQKQNTNVAGVANKTPPNIVKPSALVFLPVSRNVEENQHGVTEIYSAKVHSTARESKEKRSFEI